MTTARTHTTEDLTRLKPKHDAFVGIDSDGCVFDTMEIKQKRCFHTMILRQWSLQPIERYVREAAEFVNLYSRKRGGNRFPCLADTIDLLRDRPEVIASGVRLPDFTSLRRWVDSGVPLGNPSLEEAARATGDPELAAVLAWSKAVNDCIEKTVKGVPPFKWVRESLEKLRPRADIIVVSQTPAEALVREWSEHGIDRYAAAIAGQELGTKSEHLALATRGRYAAGRVLMIGDALGDLKAARANAALFYPINPAHEAESWARFHDEACDRFLSGTYAGAYEEARVREFEALLPDTPPWKR